MSACACGCGERTVKGTFRPGHDQKLRSELEERVGGLLRLAKLVSAAEAYSLQQIDLHALGSEVQTLLQREPR